VSPAKPPDLDPVLTDAVRRAYVRPVDQATAGRHVSAVVAAAAQAEPPHAAGRIAPLRRRRVWRPVVAAGAATLLLPVALAVAGVSLPGAIEEPFREVGISLPNQERDHESPVRPAPAVTQTVLPPVTIPPAPSSPPRRGGGAKGRNPGQAKGRDDRAIPRRPGAGPAKGAAPAPPSPSGPKSKGSGSSPRSGDKAPRRGRAKPERGNQSRGGRPATPGSERAAPKAKADQPKRSDDERPAAPEARAPSAHSPHGAP
jgi:hypothetical protein